MADRSTARSSSDPAMGATGLAQVVTAHPEWAPVLDRFGLDYCCGGRRTLLDSCAERGLDVSDVVGALERVRPHASGATAENLAGLSPSAIADHIEQTHHTFLRGTFTRLSELAQRVATVHGSRHPELTDVRATYDALRAELEPHLDREEQTVFPTIRELDAAQRSATDIAGLDGAVADLRDDHERAGELLGRLTELTGGFATPPDGCASYRAFYDGLAALVADTHLHVHEENNVLFAGVLEPARPPDGAG